MYSHRPTRILLLVCALVFIFAESNTRCQICDTCVEDGFANTFVWSPELGSNTGIDPGGYLRQITLDQSEIYYQAGARAYYSNDQRIEFTGQEDTFGVEGYFQGAIQRCTESWLVGVELELYLNQPFDRNILVDTPERVSYTGNFDIDIVEISELFVEARRGDFSVAIGKQRTPFGRAWFELQTNQRFDAPFIRTESILWRETGLFVDYRPGIWMFSLAGVNGSEDRDTNSSKAVIARIGIDRQNYVLGMSAKWQDGIGSEGQKYRNNHVGFDAMVRGNHWVLSGELIYDEYGFRRNIDPLSITWGRSIYNRDQFFPGGRLRGVGYYVDLTILGPKATWSLNYGAFHPREQTGDPIHDRVTRRGIFKYIRHAAPGLDWNNFLILENDVENAQAGKFRRGITAYSGIEYRF